MTDKINRGVSFEETCCQLLIQLGFDDCQMTQTSNDQGGDLVGGYKATRYVFQCKSHQKPVGNKAIQEAVAAKSIYGAARCGAISKGSFTSSASELARANYCLLFTYSDLKKALDGEKSFGDLIQGYDFTDSNPIEFDLDLIKAYEETKSRVGHTPQRRDFDASMLYRIKKHYGNLTNMIAAIGDVPHTIRPSVESIKSEYRRVREELERVPTLDDMTRHSDFSRNCFSSYPFTQLQMDCGDTPNIRRNVTKEELIESFRVLERKLGRIPKQKDLDDSGLYRTSYYRSRWGNYDAFLDQMGIPRYQAKQRVYESEELVLIYLLLKKVFELRQHDGDFDLNHSVLERLEYCKSALISPSSFSRRFGSWRKFQSLLSDSTLREFSESLNRLTHGILKEGLRHRSDDAP